MTDKATQEIGTKEMTLDEMGIHDLTSLKAFMYGFSTAEFVVGKADWYCKRTGIARGKLATMALNNTHAAGLFRRVEKNDEGNLATMRKVDLYIKDHPEGPPIRR